MNKHQIRQLIKDGEGLNCEFKEAADKMPGSLFATVCAFLNTGGGTVLLGVSDSGEIKGIRPDNVIPFPKNPSISKFMLQLGRFDELGSGVINVNKYLPFYANGAVPEFIEGNTFKTIIPIEMGDKVQDKQVNANNSNPGYS